MDLLKLDTNFLPIEIVDSYETLIWTERYNQSGDLTLTLPQGSPALSLLSEGDFLSIEDSKDVMVIETISFKEGVHTILAPALTDFLKQRMLRNTWSTAKSNWSLNGYPGTLAGNIVFEMCGAGGLMADNAIIPGGSSEVIPNLVIENLTSGSAADINVAYGMLYDGVKGLCDMDSLGFRLWPRLKTGGYDIVFTVWKGLDRTTSQGVNSWVIFEPAMDSLTNVQRLRSIAGYKTAAYAFANGMTSQSQVGVATVPGAPSSGWGRRTLMVDANDVNASDYSAGVLTSILNRRAKDALVNNNYVRMVDGELVPQNAFKYGTDYNLGDVIELRDENEIADKARVVEYIRAKSATGDLAYPTLSVI